MEDISRYFEKIAQNYTEMKTENQAKQLFSSTKTNDMAHM